MASYFWICLTFLLANTRSTPIHQKNIAYRLPEGVVEVNHYDIALTLKTDVFETNTFSAVTYIKFRSVINSNEIKLHVNGLAIAEVQLAAQDSTLINLKNKNFDSDSATDILTLTTSTTLKANAEYQLKFTYEGKLQTDEMYGFYRSSYIANDGTTVYLATTQFQPTHARKAFPCFDEPSYKAQFDIKITHPNKYNAVGNSQVNTRKEM